MNIYCSVADTILEIKNATSEIIDYFNGFIYEVRETIPEIIFTVRYINEFPEPEYRPTMQALFGIQYASLPESKKPWRHILAVTSEDKEYLIANSDWSEAVLVLDPSYHKALFEKHPKWAGLIMCGFYFRLLLSETLILHASAVEYDGKAVVFTAPSKTGKTTQAELWEKYVGARILNGDKVFFRIDEGKIMAWGSPWSGSSPYRVNACANVAAIIVLSKAQENRLFRLDTISAISQFSPNVFLPVWERDSLIRGMDTLDKIVSQIPIYHLEAKKDEEAVRIVQREIFGVKML